MVALSREMFVAGSLGFALGTFSRLTAIAQPWAGFGGLSGANL